MIITFWNYISNLGLDKIEDPFTKNKIQSFNKILLTLIFINISLSIFWSNIATTQSIAISLLVIVNTISLILIKNGRHLLARIIVSYSATIIITIVAALSGRETMTHLILIYSVATVFLLFDYRKERKIILISVCFMYSCLIGLEVFAFEGFTGGKLPRKETTFFYYMHLGLSIFIFILFAIVARAMAHAEQSLEKKNGELSSANKKLQKALNVKSQFLSNMSHEMRTPLNSILGFIDILKESESEIPKQEYLEHIKMASENMISLVNDVLDLSKYESGLLKVKSELFSINQTINEVYNLLRLSAENKELNLIKKNDPSIVENYFGDSLLLKQVLTNLLSNAIKFTNSGSISLETKILSNKENKQKIEFKITDTGIGITPKDQQLIFNNFIQIETQNNRSFTGTGLGLSICKKIIEAMNGKLLLESKLNYGSTFSFVIDFKVASPIKTDVNKTTASHKLRGKKALIVDDNYMNLLLLEKLLTDIGITTKLANDASEALTLLKSKQFDFLLSDLQMPETTGIDLIKELNTNSDLYPLNNEVKTAIITADVLNETKEEIEAADINHILTKPIKRVLLIDLLNNWID